MDQYFSLLQNCLLFRNLSRREVEVILTSMKQRIREYPSGSVIALEGEDCHVLGIVLEGKIEIQKLSPSGKTVTVAQFSQGIFLEKPLFFPKNIFYPGTIVTRTRRKYCSCPGKR
jgi:CRP-like cAMP-binding protein